MFLNSPIPPVTLSSTTTRLSLSTTTTRSASAIGTTSDKMEEDNDDDKKIPPLVLLGDRELMTPCEPCDLTLLQQPEQPGCKTSLPEQLEMLKQCQKAYGGIGIAACQVGWRTRIFCMGIDETDMAARTRYPNAPPFPYQIWINPTIEFLVDETRKKVATIRTKRAVLRKPLQRQHPTLHRPRGFGKVVCRCQGCGDGWNDPTEFEFMVGMKEAKK